MFKKLTYFVCLLGVTASMSVAPAAATDKADSEAFVRAPSALS